MSLFLGEISLKKYLILIVSIDFKRIGFVGRGEDVQERSAVSPSGSRRGCVDERSPRLDHPVHEVRSGGEENGRREGLVQQERRHQSAQHQSVADESHATADLACHRSAHIESNGRHERADKHDETDARWRLGKDVWWNGRTIKITLS